MQGSDKPTLRESVGTAVNSSDLSPNRMGVARLMALGLADAFGAELWRIKYGGDHGALPRAAGLLYKRSQGALPWAAKLDQLLLLAICKYLLNAWVQDRCPRCKGRGRIGLSRGAAISSQNQCEPCAGTGRIEVAGQLLSRARAEGFMVVAPGGVVYDPKAIAVPLSICDNCHGRGFVFTEEQQKASLGSVCPMCNGSHKRRVNGAERARVVGISTQGYWKVWHRRFVAVDELIKAADQDAAYDVMVGFGLRPK